MADAHVPPESGDAKPTAPGGPGEGGPARRQALRLRDAETVATTRLDMFGDPTIKEALAGQAPSPVDAAQPQGTADAAEPPEQRAEPPAAGEPLPAAPDSPASDTLAPPPPPRWDAEQRFETGLEDILVDPSAADAAAPVAATAPAPESADTPITEEPSATEPAVAPDGAAEASPPPTAPDTAGAPPGEPARESGDAGPFGIPFMMPPGSFEQDGGGPMNEPPRFRDELMFVRDTDGTPITADAAILAEPLPPPDALPPPTPEMAPPEPAFDDEPEPMPEPQSAAPSFPMFSLVSPPPEADTGFDEPALPPPDPPLHELPEPPPPEPAPPELRPRLDAAARIAAEANATAAALENLERLLAQNRPHPHEPEPEPWAYQPDPFIAPAPPPPPMESPRLRMRIGGSEPPLPSPFAEPPLASPFPEPPRPSPFPAPLLPLPARPPRGRRSIYVVGFLTGLLLALLAGAILLFFILQSA
jgi:hypothetical protein